jgi:hypothetical protein
LSQQPSRQLFYNDDHEHPIEQPIKANASDCLQQQVCSRLSILAGESSTVNSTTLGVLILVVRKGSCPITFSLEDSNDHTAIRS